MSTNMIYKKLLYIILFLLVAACSSGKIIPTSDVCSLKKHYKDNVFQVLINDQVISKHWYIYKDAKDVAKMLTEENKCKTGTW